MTATADPRPAGPAGLGMSGDAQKAEELRWHKRRATGLLVLAAVVYIIMLFTSGDGWKGYLEAFAEAAMVGALADWFAVTALFKHPLGIPIPHTAIIPKRKDEIGESLGDFVQENFLQREILASRIMQASIASRLGAWLEEPENAARSGDGAAMILAGGLDVFKDDEIRESLFDIVNQRIEAVDLAPVLARMIEFAVEGDHHHAFFDSSLKGVESMLEDNKEIMRVQLDKESPWWVPEPLDDRVFEKIYAGVQNFIRDVNRNPNHDVRKKMDERIRVTAERLRTSPELAQRAEEIKGELLSHPQAREWSEGIWESVKSEVIRAANTPESDLRLRLRGVAISAGRTLREDPELRAKVDGWLAEIVGRLAEESRNEVSNLIASTVQMWDADETSERIELQIGRDLQFIRINGTLVGGLAGLVIHALTHLLT